MNLSAGSTANFDFEQEWLFALVFSFMYNATLLGAWALGPVTDLHIRNAHIAPDGYMRSAVLAEGSLPGPIITGRKGDTFQINVINELKDDSMFKSTSIHWHGLFQKNTSWADGVSFVSQCPIVTGNSFQYQFDVPNQAGTFWYHSHFSTQYCDGLGGAIVIYDPEDPQGYLYDIDDESTVITLADWYHKPAPYYLNKNPDPPDSILINGLGRYPSGPRSGLAVVNVIQGKRYRFRLVAMACEANFKFSIDSHKLLVIEVDGVNVEPLLVESLQLFSGQRYSVVLLANNPIGNYWIRAQPNLGYTGFENGMNQAILRYRGADVSEPIEQSVDPLVSNLLLETNLHPLEHPGAPGEPHIDGADVNINLVMDFNLTSFHFTVNGVTFVSPSVPVLLQVLSGSQSAQSLLPSGSIYTLPSNKVVQLSLSPGVAAKFAGLHPFHLHGHTFDVIRGAGSTDYNYFNPIRRDVVSTGGMEDNVTIRFVTDNSGPWFLHCHIDWHLEAGLAIVFVEDRLNIPSDTHPPSSWHDLCPIYDNLNTTQLGGITPIITVNAPVEIPWTFTYDRVCLVIVSLCVFFIWGIRHFRFFHTSTVLAKL